MQRFLQTSVAMLNPMAWVSAAQVRLLAHGYTSNFIEPVLGMIQGHGDAAEPAVLCDLVPRKQASAIRGFVIVTPPVNHGLSTDAMEEAVKEYGIEHLVIRDGRDMRTVSYAYDFVVDFPRTIKALSQSEHVGSFKSYINEHQHNPLVTVVAWDEFTEVMKYLKEAKAGSNGEIDGLSWAELERRVHKSGDTT